VILLFSNYQVVDVYLVIRERT